MASPFAGAKWIWSEEDPDLPNRWVYLRRKFRLAGEGARIHCCADMRYRLWVNGRLVGFGPAKYHLPQPTYDTYDLAPFTEPRDNVVCFLVHSVGNTPNYGSFMPRRGALIAVIEAGDERIVSDASWRAMREAAYSADTPRQSSHQSFVECFDARRSCGSPWRSDYDDSAWPQARELSGETFAPWEKLEPRDIDYLIAEPLPPLRLYETGIAVAPGELDPLDMTTHAQLLARAEHHAASAEIVRPQRAQPGRRPTVLFAPPADLRRAAYAIWDFGRVISGYVAIAVKGEPGTILDLAYGEHLADGQVNANKQTIRYTDRLILGDGLLRHVVMLPKTLRFLQLAVRAGRAEVQEVQVWVSTYPVERRGSFHCPDEVLDHAWELGAHTVQLCMEDSYLDTPWRERSAWLADAVVEARANYHAFGDMALMRRLLDLIMRGQQPDGLISGKYPTLTPSYIPTWSLTFNFALADYVLYTGDCDLARRLWPGVLRLRDWLERRIGPTGLLEDLPQTPWRNYVLVDWAPLDHRGAISSLNAHYVQFLRDGAWLASQLGEPQADWLAAAQKVAEAFRRSFWSVERNLFVNNACQGVPSRRVAQHENLLAILYGIASAEQESAILATLLRERPLPVFDELADQWLIARNEYPWDDERIVPAGSPYFSYYVLRALFEVGRTEEALEYIRRHWGGAAARGATSVWESWNPFAGSLSHGWSAGPTALLSEYVLGAAPTTPGWRTFDLLPSPGDLAGARGRVATPLGTLEVKWRRQPKWRLELIVPEGATARAGLPLGEAGSLLLDGRPAATQPVSLRRGHYLAVQVGPGSHSLDEPQRPPGQAGVVNV